MVRVAEDGVEGRGMEGAEEKKVRKLAQVGR
jgi:hypothetical protein